MALKPGEKAVDFSAMAWFPQEEKEGNFHLKDYRGKKVVLLFYPGDFTPVCTAEMCDFQDNIGAFRNVGVDVVGISVDPIAKHKEFAKKYQLNFPLVSDDSREIGKQYGVIGPLGRSHRRAIFLIDEEGNVLWSKVEATALFRTGAQKVLEIIEKTNNENH
ncbi:MAG: peroxiredoxin [Candidatus Hydrogenedentota bacterium]|nr:MAG: peroxiredoxin [Candidatus Hydrogenedentota bacterium]